MHELVSWLAQQVGLDDRAWRRSGIDGTGLVSRVLDISRLVSGSSRNRGKQLVSLSLFKRGITWPQLANFDATCAERQPQDRFTGF